MNSLIALARSYLPYSFPFHVRHTLRKNPNKVTLGPNTKNQSAKAASVESAKVQLTLPF
jgi:hypothetical protein